MFGITLSSIMTKLSFLSLLLLYGRLLPFVLFKINGVSSSLLG